MEKERSYEGGFSVIEVTAALAVLLLIVSTAWKSSTKMHDQNSNLTYAEPSVASTKANPAPDPYAEALAQVTASSAPSTAFDSTVMQQVLNSYITSKNQGTYTPEYAASLGSSLAPLLHTELAHQKFTEKDVVTNSDTSEKASLAYQNALHDALAPLRTNTSPEFEFFEMYLQTKDQKYLTDLLKVSSLYQNAASNASLLVVPTDVVSYHVAILNALEEFAAVLSALNLHANDPIESTMLLQNYNSSEQDVLTAFNALRTYYVNKYAH